MAISFNSLPTQNVQSNSEVTITPGRYTCTIKSAEVKKSQAGTNYLNIRYAVQTPEGNISVFDIISESDKPLAMYKLQRFIVALKMDKALRNQTFELTDLAKLVVNKTLLADLKMDTPPAESKYKPRPTVDCFTGDIYYPIDSIDTIAPDIDQPELTAAEEDDYPFDLGNNQIELDDIEEDI